MKILEDIGYIKRNPTLYQLVQKLRVTRSKARNLIYDQELRRLDTNQLDARVKNAILNPIIQKDGELFLLEIENPLVADHLRSKVQELGYLTDSSFSPSVVKIPLRAVVAVIEDYIPKDERKSVRKTLIKAGAPDTSLQGILISTLKGVAIKLASDTGEAVVDNISTYLSPLLDGVIDTAIDKFANLYKPENKGTTK